MYECSFFFYNFTPELPLGVQILYISNKSIFLQYIDFTMHSLISIMGVFLTGKENYPEWSWNIKHTLIFNELWKGVFVGEGDNEPAKPTSDKEFTIWENKNKKAYAFIVAFLNERLFTIFHHIRILLKP